jgi:transcriptional regulator with XRE-family HTH domain
MNKEIGNILRKARGRKRLRQEDMAIRLGITSRQYQKYEDGTFPKYKTEHIRKIDEILGIQIYKLIYENVPVESNQQHTSTSSGADSYKDKYIVLLEEKIEHYDIILKELREIKELLLK